METKQLPNFKQAILALGPTDEIRARQLGVSRRTFMDYKRAIPTGMRRLIRRDILEALLRDVDLLDSSTQTQSEKLHTN